jgi:glycerate kinase
MNPATILVAPNAFKESLTAVEAAECIKRGLSKVFNIEDIILLPVADGGDGSLDVLINVLELNTENFETTDPLGRTITAPVGFSANEAFVEMATATGLHLLKDEERNAGVADSSGTGVLIKKVLEKDIKKINLFIGGTASMDAGTGILRVLGFHFYDENGEEVTGGGKNLGRIKEYSSPESLKKYKQAQIKIYCDVDNPMTGSKGSVKVFGPQKDSGITDMDELEEAFESYARFLSGISGEDIASLKGGGAAGAVAAGLKAFLNVQLISGGESILDLCDFDHYLDKADLVITGEGKLDDQSLEGKAPVIVAKKARSRNKKVIFIGGSIPGSIENEVNGLFDAVVTIVPGPVDLSLAIKHASEWLERTAFQVGRLLFL